jgi:hypothetical protein
MTFQVETSQTRTSPSWCPEMNRRPSPLKAPDQTAEPFGCGWVEAGSSVR